METDRPKAEVPQEFVSRMESLWSDRLRAAGLVCEVPVPSKTSQKCAQSIGWFWRNKPRVFARTLNSYPASVVLALTGAAVDGYQAGAFWDSFRRLSGADFDHAAQKAIGEAFLRGLRKLGLPTFPDAPKPVLGPVLMHAGVPTYCLGDYFRAIEMALRAVGPDAQEIVEWVGSHANTSLANVDRPVVRFIGEGGEYSTDFVDRTVDLLDDLASDSDVTASLLPERIVDAARQYIESERRSGNRTAGVKGRRRATRPIVALDPYGGELKLVLPSLADVDYGFEWRVSLDGAERLLEPDLEVGGWRIGSRESELPLSSPVRRIGISAEEVSLDHEIVLFEDSEPMLVFDEIGRLLSTKQSLPDSDVWILFRLPDGVSLPTFAERIRIEEPPPIGWTGWSLVRVDLRGETVLRLASNSPPHSVRVQSRASISDGEVVEWARADGLPVMSTRPVVNIPAGIGVDWYITVTEEATGHSYRSALSTRPGDGSPLDPFNLRTDPVVGIYEIKVEGPLGRGTKRRFAIVEGLTCLPADTWRPFARDGLTLLKLELSGQALTVEPELLCLGPRDESATVIANGANGTLPLHVRPQSMAVAIERNGIPGAWSSGRVTLNNDSLANKRILIRVPPDKRTSWLRVMSNGECIQEVPPSASASKGYRIFPLAGLGDTMAVHPVCDLTLEVGGVSLEVARIQPRFVASGAEWRDNELWLTDFTGGSVMARVWSVWEPWQPRADIFLEAGGRVAIPESLRQVGPLAVSWERHDPWVVTTSPAFPEPGTFRIVETPVDLNGASQTVLAFHTESQTPDPIEPDRAWALLAMRYHVPQPLLPWPTVLSLITGLREDPIGALAALSDSKLEARDRVRALIQSGVAWARTEKQLANEADDKALRAIFRRSPLAGTLLATPILVDECGPVDFPETWAECVGQLGSAFTAMVAGSPDPFVREGGFKNGKVLEEMPEDLLAELIDRLRVVPKTALDGDSRVRVAIDLFEKRHATTVKRMSFGAREHVVMAQEMCKQWNFEEGLRLMACRDEVHQLGGWYALSAASAALALLARLAAQGETRATDYLEANFGAWVDFAHVAPDHVALDLILAEVMVATHTANSLPIIELADKEDDDDAAH
jgi:hypothetical protein